MQPIRVLVVDDSVLFRSAIRTALLQIPGFVCVGVASSGRIALQRLEAESVDLVILDHEMPEMLGSQVVREIRARGLTCKVLMFASTTRSGAEETLECLKNGASDFLEKPGADPAESSSASGSLSSEPVERIVESLRPKLMALFPRQDPPRSSPAGARVSGPWTPVPEAEWRAMRPRIVVIGASTGGPAVLESIFGNLGCTVHCPVVIVQHMPPVFTAAFAGRLGRLGKVPASEAVDGEPLLSNRIYVAPGNFHLSLTGRIGGVTLRLDQSPQIHSVRPAVDPLFESAASIYGAECFGIVLTGMGADGRSGAIALKNAGGAIAIQDEASCVVFGMPGAVHAAGAFDRLLSPEAITSHLRAVVGMKEGEEMR